MGTPYSVDGGGEGGDGDILINMETLEPILLVDPVNARDPDNKGARDAAISVAIIDGGTFT